MKKVLLYLILLMAITMAGVVAYVSVTGLLKVFTGAGTMGLILFTCIEVGKIIATSAVHTYGKKIGIIYSSLLSLFIVISMVITSMGIYGFLSSSYKESFAKMEGMNSQIELLVNKKNGYNTQLEILNIEKKNLSQTVTELTKGLANNVIQYKDRETGEIITTTSSSTRRALERQLKTSNNKLIVVDSKLDSLSNIVFNLENEILQFKLGNEGASELSSLQYLSDVTDQSMDDVMKWFILLLIIIGDPMAVLMVIVFNKIVYKNDEDESPNDDDDDSVEIDLTGPTKPIPSEVWVGEAKETDVINDADNATNSVLNDADNTTNSVLNDADMEELKSKGLGPFSNYNQIIGELWKEKNTNDAVNDTVNDTVNDVVNDVVDKVMTEAIVDVLLDSTDGEVVKEEVKEEIKEEVNIIKTQPKTITDEDIKEIKSNRGFTVPVPKRQINNNAKSSIGRINTNSKPNTLFSKKPKK